MAAPHVQTALVERHPRAALAADSTLPLAGARARVLYLVSHPIQYQAPLLEHLAAQPWLDLEVAFLSDCSVREHFDAGFGQRFAWDLDLLGGYPHRFLEARFGAAGLDPLRPCARGLSDLIDPQRFDALWIHGYAQVSMLEALTLAKRRGLKVLLRGESLLVGRPSSDWRSHLRTWILPRILKHIDACLTIGTWNELFYRRYGVPEARLQRMPYAVDNRRFLAAARAAAPKREALRQELGLDPALPVVLYASKFQARKRPLELVEACLALNAAGLAHELLMVGDGELRQRLTARAAAVPGARVHFLGFKNQGELPRYYDLCDLFVLPSSYEPWGLVVNEAMACERPVLASSAVGSARDLVLEGRTGWTFDNERPAGLGQALATALSDRGRLADAGHAAAQHLERFDFEADAAGLRQALSKLGLLR